MCIKVMCEEIREGESFSIHYIKWNWTDRLSTPTQAIFFFHRSFTCCKTTVKLREFLVLHDDTMNRQFIFDSTFSDVSAELHMFAARWPPEPIPATIDNACLYHKHVFIMFIPDTTRGTFPRRPRSQAPLFCFFKNNASKPRIIRQARPT